MALLPPLSLLLSFVALVLLLPHHERNWILPGGLMLLLLTHELGHLFVLRLKGIPARGPYFIPLLGAFVMMSRPSKGEDVAQVALAGPFFGGLGALFCLVMAWIVGAHNCDQHTLAQGFAALMSPTCYAFGSGSQWLALAHIGFLFNLINLIPLLPFDGGQAIGIASRWLWLLGVPVGILFLQRSVQLWQTPSTAPIGVVQGTASIGILLSAVVLGILLFSLGTTCYALWKPSFAGAGPSALPPVPFVRRILILLLYLLLSGVLFLGDHFVLTILR
jgi:Zn-dependent protease